MTGGGGMRGPRVRQAMFSCAAALMVLAACVAAFGQDAANGAPAQRKEQAMDAGKIATVSKELYIPSPREGVPAILWTSYVGNGLRRLEHKTDEVGSDVYVNPWERYSDDNGRTWTEWQQQPKSDYVQGDLSRALMHLAFCHDPVSQRTVHLVMEVLRAGESRYLHTFHRSSQDEGRTFTPYKLLRFEDGPEQDPENWAKPEYVGANSVYGGYNLIPLRNGTIITACCGQRVTVTNAEGEKEKVGGIRCWIGRWDAEREEYDWDISEPVAVPKSICAGGLCEGYLAELQSGELLLEMRGTNTEVTPGHKWISVSRDGGHTWSDVTDLRYDDGTQFYAAAAMARMIRSTRTGKLYWVGNISPEPPQGGLPRHPLHMAEIDETLYALRRSTVTILDTVDPEIDSPETTRVNLSNFRIFENRETGDFEMYMARYGQHGPRRPAFWTADVYKYLIHLTE